LLRTSNPKVAGSSPVGRVFINPFHKRYYVFPEKAFRDTNHYLKWAFSEAGNSVAVNRNRFPVRHVSKLYNPIRGRKDHAKAVGAVSRHLAEATYWVLTKAEVYRDRGLLDVSSTWA